LDPGCSGSSSKEYEDMKITGAEILIEALKKEGVKHIFGYPGVLFLIYLISCMTKKTFS